MLRITSIGDIHAKLWCPRIAAATVDVRSEKNHELTTKHSNPPVHITATLGNVPSQYRLVFVLQVQLGEGSYRSEVRLERGRC
jgi:hypothetical protein